MAERKSNKVLHSQARELILHVSNFCEQEAAVQAPKVPMKRWLERSSECLGVSKATIKRIRKDVKEGKQLATPGKSRPQKKRKTNLDEFDMAVIRRRVHYMYEQGVIPTLDKILPDVKENTNFTGGRSSLYSILKKMGFRFAKADGRKYLLERSDIISLRHSYLRTLRENRMSANPRPVIYQDETWLNAHHSVKKCWQLDHPETSQSSGLKVPAGQGTRLIISHAGSENGFVPNALLTFKAKSKTGDYHDEMNGENFKKWFTEQLLPNILVIDNTSY